jgi:hypothetical protein
LFLTLVVATEPSSASSKDPTRFGDDRQRFARSERPENGPHPAEQLAIALNCIRTD